MTINYSIRISNNITNNQKLIIGSENKYAECFSCSENHSAIYFNCNAWMINYSFSLSNGVTTKHWLVIRDTPASPQYGQ